LSHKFVFVISRSRHVLSAPLVILCTIQDRALGAKSQQAETSVVAAIAVGAVTAVVGVGHI